AKKDLEGLAAQLEHTQSLTDWATVQFRSKEFIAAKERGDSAAMDSIGKEIEAALTDVKAAAEAAIAAGHIKPSQIPYVRHDVQELERQWREAQTNGYIDTKVQPPALARVAPPPPPPSPDPLEIM